MKEASLGNLKEAFVLKFFHQFKAVFLLYVGIFLVVHFAEEHVLLANPQGVVSVQSAVDHIFFRCFGMEGHVFHDVEAVLEMTVETVDFHFAFFGHRLPAWTRLDNGDSGSRTHDLLIANQSLYQLSYIPGMALNIVTLKYAQMFTILEI